MSDCTRLIYDIIHFAECKKIPGLLMLVDFKKSIRFGVMGFPN